MTDIARRFDNNPILSPGDISPSIPGFSVAGVLNPGAFRYRGKTGLLLRVAEIPPKAKNKVTAPVRDEHGRMGLLEHPENDPDVISGDPRIFSHKGVSYLTNISHLRLAWSGDGVHFEVEKEPALIGEGPYETYGIEDCRVTVIGDTYHLTYTAVSANGVAVARATTQDWRNFQRYGVILPPHNKDCAIFSRKVNGWYYALHRPSGADLGGNFIWIARSRDLLYWGDHQCIARTRPGLWDSERVGAGAAPIETEKGWLEIYHGADDHSRYRLGALLLDLDNPAKVIARSKEPIMEPIKPYEQEGFFGNVVFTNGHVIDGDRLTVYYGASDETVCGAEFSINRVHSTLL